MEEKEKENLETNINFNLVNIENTSKSRNNTIFIIIIVAIIVMIIGCISAIFVVNAVRNKKSEEDKEEESVPEVVEEVSGPTRKLPIYSEEAKIRMQNIYNAGEEKQVYLTFDDGPSNNITPQILDILKEEEVKATFFVLGSRVEVYPELVKREYEEGHFIANHGYSHMYGSVYSSKEAVLEEYNHTEQVIKNAIGNADYSSHLFRFPGGSEGGKYKKVKDEAKEFLKANGVEFINWNCLTNDAVGTPTYQSLILDLLKTSERKESSSRFNA